MKNNANIGSIKATSIGAISDKLARLLADERLTVEHGSFNTASFNPTSRVICLPIFKDMTDSMYFLFVSHEVGHALYTPRDGWHNAGTEIPGCPRAYINIIEDIRIEKLIRRKYEGLYREFFAGYSDLLQRDFFGIQGVDLKTLGFMNRLNLHSKCENLLDVPFTDEEMRIVAIAMSVETWEDVVRICRLLKEEVPKLPEFPFAAKSDKGKSDTGASEEESTESGAGDETSFDDGDATSGAEPSDEGKGDTAAADEDKEEADNKNDSSPSRGQDLAEPNLDPRSSNTDVSTDTHYRAAERNSVDKSAVMLDINAKPKNTIPAVGNVINSRYASFVAKNKTLISKMVNEFNLRKAATRERKAQEAKTGSLDPLKLFDYKFNDDIFLRHHMMQNEENHGVVMYIDYSGSMNGLRIRALFNQAALMSEFYTKVGIKFRVYIWTTGYGGDCRITSGCNVKLILCNSWPRDKYRQYVSAMLADNPDFGGMGGTPIEAALALLVNHGLQLKEEHSLEKVHLILMTDGPSWGHGPFRCADTKTAYVKIGRKTYISSMMKSAPPEEHIINLARKMFDSVGYYVVDSGYAPDKDHTTVMETRDISVYETPGYFSYIVRTNSRYIMDCLGSSSNVSDYKKFLRLFVGHIA